MNWVSIKDILILPNNEGISLINDASADKIVGLLQKAQNNDVLVGDEITQVADAIKLISITTPLHQIFELLETISSTNIIKMKIRWWRKFVNYLIVSGFTIVMIDKIVPIQFKLIGQMVYAYMGSLGTNVSRTIGSVSGIGASMGRPPISPLPVQIISQTIWSVATYALSACRSAVSSAVNGVCSFVSSGNLADLIVDSTAVKIAKDGIKFFDKFNNGDYDDALVFIIENKIAFYNDSISIMIENILTIQENRVDIVLDEHAHITDRNLGPTTQSVINKSFHDEIDFIMRYSRFSRRAIIEDLSQLEGSRDTQLRGKIIKKFGVQIVVLYDLIHSAPNQLPVSKSKLFKKNEQSKQQRRRSKSMPNNIKFKKTYKHPSIQHLWIQDTFKYIDEFTSDDNCIKQVLGQLFNTNHMWGGNLYTAIQTNNLTAEEQRKIFNDINHGCRYIKGKDTDADTDAELIAGIASHVRAMIQDFRPTNISPLRFPPINLCSDGSCSEQQQREQHTRDQQREKELTILREQQTQEQRGWKQRLYEKQKIQDEQLPFMCSNGSCSEQAWREQRLREQQQQVKPVISVIPVIPPYQPQPSIYINETRRQKANDTKKKQAEERKTRRNELVNPKKTKKTNSHGGKPTRKR